MEVVRAVRLECSAITHCRQAGEGQTQEAAEIATDVKGCCWKPCSVSLWCAVLVVVEVAEIESVIIGEASHDVGPVPVVVVIDNRVVSAASQVIRTRRRMDQQHLQ